MRPADRRGFALLTVLWLVAVLAVLAGTALAAARTGSNATRNRVILTRGVWAREACLSILQARWVADSSIRLLDTVDLGRGTWCRGVLDSPDARLDLNHADAGALRAVLGSDSLVDALLDWRDPDDVARPAGAEAEWYRLHALRPPRNAPLAAAAELAFVRGFDAAVRARIAALVTTRGTGRLDLSAAPPELLAMVPGLTVEAVDVILRRRRSRPIGSVEELAAALSAGGRATLLRSYREFLAGASFGPTRLVATLEGGVHGYGAVSRAVVTLTPLPGRLAVVRREAR